LAFPASPLTFSRCRAGLRGIPPPVVAATRRCWHVNRSSPSSRPESRPPLARLVRPGTAEAALLPSIHEVFPSSDMHPVRQLPDSEESFGVPMPLDAHVPPAWFFTTSAGCSDPALQVCCTLLPDMGFAAFPVPDRCQIRRSARHAGHFSRRAITPRRIPLVDSRTASPRPVALMLLPLDPHRNAVVPSSQSSRATPALPTRRSQSSSQDHPGAEARSVPGWALDSKLSATLVGSSPAPALVALARRPGFCAWVTSARLRHLCPKTSARQRYSRRAATPFLLIRPESLHWSHFVARLPWPRSLAETKVHDHTRIGSCPDYGDALVSEETSTSLSSGRHDHRSGRSCLAPLATHPEGQVPVSAMYRSWLPLRPMQSTVFHPSRVPASPGLARKRAPPRSADRYTTSEPTPL